MICRHCGRVMGPKHVYQASGKPRCLNNRTWTTARRFALLTLWEQGFSDRQIGARLGVSAEAIRVMRVRLGISRRRANRDVFTAQEAARMMGCGCAKTITRWIEHGLLRGRRGSVRQGRNRLWQITRNALEAFVRDPRTWPSWRVEAITDPLLQSIAAEARGGVRFLTLGEAADRFGVDTSTVGQWVDNGWLPAVRIGERGNHVVRLADVDRLAPGYVYGNGLKEAA